MTEFMNTAPYFRDQTIIKVPAPEGYGYVAKYRVKKRILKTSQVYICEDIDDTNKEVVVKAEEIGGQNSNLAKEWAFYEKLSICDDFKIVLNNFIGLNHRYLIMEKRGEDLRCHYKRLIKANLWTDSHLNKYAVQMISALQKCHSFGIIHLDPKPNNYVLDPNDENKLYLIDFDVAMKYIDSNGQHIPYRKDIPFYQIRGNRSYISLNSHNCEEQSRKDDVIFLGYSLIWMARNGLPWTHFNLTATNRREFYQYIKEEKSRYSLEELCVNTENKVLENLVQYMKYCTELSFESEPDYSYLISLFQRKESMETEAYCL